MSTTPWSCALAFLALTSGTAQAMNPDAPMKARPPESGVLGAEGDTPSRSPLTGDLRGRGPSLAEPGSASPFGERSLPTPPALGASGANGVGVPSATPRPVIPDADTMTPLRVEPAAERADSLPTEAEKVPRGACGIADLAGGGHDAGRTQDHGDPDKKPDGTSATRALLAPASPRCAAGYLRWVAGLRDAAPEPAHPAPAYRFEAELHRDLAAQVAEQPGLVTPFVVGTSVRGRPIWGFRVLQPGVAVRQTLLVVANLHALEWVPSEIATDFVTGLAHHPPPGVSTIVVPTMNPDGRARVEMDLRRGDNRFRRGNANNIDLNRDFAELRDGPTPFRWMMPWRYGGTPGPLSQPESRALDALADAGRFDAAVSLHAFGGYLFYPYAGAWERPPDHAALHRMAVTMQGGMGNGAYQPRQLSRFFFAFVGQGMEIDHLYRRYGTRAVLVETTRSGLSPLRPRAWGTHFRWYNPQDPAPDVRDNLGALRALAWSLAFDTP